MKLCSESGAWVDHFRARHPAESVNTEVEVPRKDALVDDVGIIAEATTEDLSDELSDGALARLCLSRLI